MAEPITLAEAKAHLRVVDTSEDDLIGSLITAARQWVENQTGHILVQREFVEQRDAFGTFIQLHRVPVEADSVEIAYVDSEGASAAYEDFVAFTDRTPVRIHPERGGAWPTVGEYGGVTVTYTAGYGAGEAPQPLLQAMLLLIGHWFVHRSGVATGQVGEVPLAVSALTDQFSPPGL